MSIHRIMKGKMFHRPNFIEQQKQEMKNQLCDKINYSKTDITEIYSRADVLK